MRKLILTSTLAALFLAAGVATAAEPAVSPAKQELVNQILKLSNMEYVGQKMLQQRVNEAVQQARVVLQSRGNPEKRDAAMTDVIKEAKTFMDQAGPISNASSDKLSPGILGPALLERFNEEELRQVIALLQSPVRQRFDALVLEAEHKLGPAVSADAGAAINPKLKELNERIGTRLQTALLP